MEGFSLTHNISYTRAREGTLQVAVSDSVYPLVLIAHQYCLLKHLVSVDKVLLDIKTHPDHEEI